DENSSIGRPRRPKGVDESAPRASGSRTGGLPVGAKKQTRAAAEQAIARIEAHRDLAAAEISAHVDELAAIAARADEALAAVRAPPAAIADPAQQRDHELDAARDSVRAAAAEFVSHVRQQVGEVDRQRARVAAHLDEQCDAAVARLHGELEA